jgi:DNA topoisomerase-1
LGAHPENGHKIVAYNGRFGPYVKCGEETRSLPADMSPLDVTLEQALELLAHPKKMRTFGAKREPIKVFAESPVTKQKVELLEGRYGPYVSDGENNASLPKGAVIEELTFEEALTLLAARAAAGGSRKPKRRPFKKAAPKKEAKPAAAKKTPAVKKPAAKKKGAKRAAKRASGSQEVA